MNTQLTKHVSNAKLLTKKYSPEILVSVGVVGMVASAIMACKNTLKLPEVIEDHNNRVEDLHLTIEEYPEMEQKEVNKITAKTYLHTIGDLSKLYAPSVLLCSASIFTIFASNTIYRRRTAQLSAAYFTLDRMYKTYRQNVIEEFGEDVDYRMKYGIKTVEVEEEYEDKKGNKKTKKKKVDVVTNPLDMYSEYARFFDEASREWNKNSEVNRETLAVKEKFANDKLIAQGYLFLNEVYEMLDIPLTEAGQQVGWIYDPDSDDYKNYVSFNVHNVALPGHQDFIDGYTNNILLDFNVDGIIMDKFTKYMA